MKIFTTPPYTEIVRVELMELATKEMRSISFCKTTIAEVREHVLEKLKTVNRGKKVRVVIRVSDPIKRWGKQSGFTVYIRDIDKAIKQISKGVKAIDWKSIKG